MASLAELLQVHPPCLLVHVALPLRLAGVFRIGGNVNSLHAFWLWFPPTLIILTTGSAWGRLGRRGILAMALGRRGFGQPPAADLPAPRAAQRPGPPRGRLPGKIWFPLHPLGTLSGERRPDHDVDGLGERRLADPADGRIPPDLPVRSFWLWRIDGGLR